MDLTNFEDRVPPPKEKKRAEAKPEPDIEQLKQEIREAQTQPNQLIATQWMLYVERENSGVVVHYSDRKPQVNVVGNLIHVSGPLYDYVFTADSVKFISVQEHKP